MITIFIVHISLKHTSKSDDYHNNAIKK